MAALDNRFIFKIDYHHPETSQQGVLWYMIKPDGWWAAYDSNSINPELYLDKLLLQIQIVLMKGTS